MTPKRELKLAVDGLKSACKQEIILFHDRKAQTAAMLPAFALSKGQSLSRGPCGAGLTWHRFRRRPLISGNHV
jgi:hypothetical protein